MTKDAPGGTGQKWKCWISGWSIYSLYWHELHSEQAHCAARQKTWLCLLRDCEMKSNNVDSGSWGSNVDVALQCQHTSINNLIKSSLVKTLFQLPFFFQMCSKHPQLNPHSASCFQIIRCGLSPTGGSFKFIISMPSRTATGSASHFLSCLPLITAFSFSCSWSLMSLSVSLPSSFIFHWSRWTQIPHMNPTHQSNKIWLLDP